MLIAQFPEAATNDSFTPTEVKRFFYHAMPRRWRTNFINSGQSLQTTTIESLHTYIVQQEFQTDAYRHKSRDSSGNKKSTDKVPFKFNKNSSKGKKNFSNNNSKGNKESKPKKITNEDDCPIHGASHEWEQCHQNQYGENFCP